MSRPDPHTILEICIGKSSQLRCLFTAGQLVEARKKGCATRGVSTWGWIRSCSMTPSDSCANYWTSAGAGQGTLASASGLYRDFRVRVGGIVQIRLLITQVNTHLSRTSGATSTFTRSAGTGVSTPAAPCMAIFAGYGCTVHSLTRCHIRSYRAFPCFHYVFTT